MIIRNIENSYKKKMFKFHTSNLLENIVVHNLENIVVHKINTPVIKVTIPKYIISEELKNGYNNKLSRLKMT